MLYRTNVAIGLKGDRVEKDTEVELTPEEAQRYGSDLTPVSDIPEPEPEIDLSAIPLEEMTYEQLKGYARELDLSALGSKAELVERITLHLQEQQ